MIHPPLLLTVAAVSSVAAAAATRYALRPRIFQAANWQGLTIPRGYGVSFPLAQSIAVLLWWIFHADVRSLILPALALWGMTGAGLMDDLSGQPAGGGFRGHLRTLVQERRVTAGLLKAVLGGIICLAVGLSLAARSETPGWFLVGLLDGLLLALAGNAVNLLDVRPARAVKGAIVMYLIGLIALPGAALPYLPILLCALLFLPADCRGRAMMGDAGAYPLGFAAALPFLSLLLPVKVIICCILVAFHLYCEVRSLTGAIERNRILNWVDNWWVTR